MKTEHFKKGIRLGVCLFTLFLPLSISAANIAWGVVLISLIGYGIATRSLPRIRTPLEKPFLIYIAAAVLVSFLGLDPKVSFKHILSEFHKVWLFYLFSIALTIEPTPQAIRTWGIGYMLSAIIGILQVSGTYAPMEIQNQLTRWGTEHHFWKFIIPSYRACGTLHPVTYGETMSLAVMGGVCLWIYPIIKISRKMLSLFCILTLMALMLSQTRGAWLGLIVALSVILYFHKNLILSALKGSLLLILSMFLFSHFSKISLTERFFSIFSLKSLSNVGRLGLWKTALQIFKDHPILGVGINHFRTLYPQYHPERLANKDIWGSAHNLYLHQMAERGLVGLAALLLLLGTLLYQSWKRHSQNPSFLNLWTLAGVAGFLVMNVTETSFESAMVWMPILFLYAWSERTHAKREM
ncbi:MAG: O-antigen ligase family protein [Elusimicrobia bacterium]|nr:O-antigen ligase family protein [Elusimicrobiota bacterium]